LMMDPPQKRPFPPFALGYMPLEEEEKEEEMLMVRSTYERYGVLHAKPSPLADGFLATELSFMGRTCGLAQQAIELGIDRRAMQLLDEQEWFLNDHILPWVERWEKEMRKTADFEFYRHLAALTKQYLAYDAQTVNDLLDII